MVSYFTKKVFVGSNKYSFIISVKYNKATFIAMKFIVSSRTENVFVGYGAS